MSSAMSDPKYLIKRVPDNAKRPGESKHCHEAFIEGTLRLGWKETPGALKSGYAGASQPRSPSPQPAREPVSARALLPTPSIT